MATFLRRLIASAKANGLVRAAARLPGLRRIKTAVMTRVQAGEYEPWIRRRLAERAGMYEGPVEEGLFSIVTTAWNTRADYLRVLADSIFAQDGAGAAEWVLLDNGSTDGGTRACLEGIARHRSVRFHRVERNLGIVGGMRHCLQHAAGLYIVPVDSDDYLYPDCLRILAWHIRKHQSPPLLYSDEDKLRGARRLEPFLKSDWDPVLFMNAGYIAHVNCFDRRLAVALGVYQHDDAEGCHDWDTFMKFHGAGHVPLHVPEVLYSWRMHAGSTAMKVSSKSFIRDSHVALLRRRLTALGLADRLTVGPSPLFDGTPDWWIRRRHTAAGELVVVVLDDGRTATPAVGGLCDYSGVRTVGAAIGDDPRSLLGLARANASAGGWVVMVSAQAAIEGSEWPWEILALGEVHRDLAMIGGVIFGRDGIVREAGRHFGFGNGCGSPFAGLHRREYGYQALLRRQRSASAVSTQLCAVRGEFMAKFLAACPPEATLPYLGAWMGAYAMRAGRRVAFTPHMAAVCDQDWDALTTAGEKRSFLTANKDIIPDTRYYPPLASLDASRPFDPATTQERQQHLDRLLGR